MFTNIDELKRKMTEKEISNEEMARALEINPSTFYRKLQTAGENFTVGQMHRIVEVLGLNQEEVALIFLNVISQ